jgi:hypothetical protein
MVPAGGDASHSGCGTGKAHVLLRNQNGLEQRIRAHIGRALVHASASRKTGLSLCYFQVHVALHLVVEAFGAGERGIPVIHSRVLGNFGDRPRLFALAFEEVGTAQRLYDRCLVERNAVESLLELGWPASKCHFREAMLVEPLSRAPLFVQGSTRDDYRAGMIKFR